MLQARFDRMDDLFIKPDSFLQNTSNYDEFSGTYVSHYSQLIIVMEYVGKECKGNMSYNHDSTDELQSWTEDDYSLPPRKTLYPSEYLKLTQWFYRFLFGLFVLLLLILLGWGFTLHPQSESQVDEQSYNLPLELIAVTNPTLPPSKGVRA